MLDLKMNASRLSAVIGSRGLGNQVQTFIDGFVRKFK